MNDETIIGSQFDALDQALAARGLELYSRPSIYRQDYDEWIADYNRLESFANRYSYVPYVVRQWNAEKPRYANAPALLLSKVRIAQNLQTYDTSIPVDGGCNCFGSNALPSVNIPPSTLGISGSHPAGNYFFGGNSLGDNARQLLSPNNLPFFPNPQGGGKIIDKKEVFSGVLVALIVGVLLWGVHYLTKKKL